MYDLFTLPYLTLHVRSIFELTIPDEWSLGFVRVLLAPHHGGRCPGPRGSAGRGAAAVCTGGLSSRTFRSDARKRAAGRDTTNLLDPLARGAYLGRRTPPEGLATPRRDCRAGAAQRIR